MKGDTFNSPNTCPPSSAQNILHIFLEVRDEGNARKRQRAECAYPPARLARMLLTADGRIDHVAAERSAARLRVRREQQRHAARRCAYAATLERPVPRSRTTRR